MAFVLLSLSAGWLHAQGVATLSGTVSGDDGKPLQYAHVAAVSLNPVVGAVTDAKGRFELRLPKDSLLTLRVSFSGYGTIDTAMRLPSGTSTVHFRMTSGTTLGPVTISDDRTRTTTFTTIDV